MPFDLKITGDAFKQKLEEIISGLQGVTGIADDLFIYNRMEEEHNRYITAFLNWAWQHVLKIGADKIQYKKTSVKF